MPGGLSVLCDHLDTPIPFLLQASLLAGIWALLGICLAPDGSEPLSLCLGLVSLSITAPASLKRHVVKN